MANPDLFSTNVNPPPTDPDDLQATFIESPIPQGSGFSGFSGYSGSNPGQSGYSGFSGFLSSGATLSSLQPALVSTTTTVMMGLGATFVPQGTGIAEVVMSFLMANDSNQGDTAAQIAYAVGFPPAQGAAPIGTLIGNAAVFKSFNFNSGGTGVCSALVSGLAIGTQYWFDLQIGPYAANQGNSKVSDVSILIHEIGGSAGQSGTSGASGFSGFSGGGTSGFSGFSGFSGLSSMSGFSGFSGFSAASGTSGFSGFSAASGLSGFSGASGFSGPQGPQGIPGSFAASGVSGFSGYSGGNGQSGFSGFSGANPGASGFSGFSGFSSASGFSGVSGFSGFSGRNAADVIAFATPTNPASTASATGVMMGLGVTMTPTVSGNVLIVISGDTQNSGATGSTYNQIRYGTGAAPTNGAALTGTALGGLVTSKAGSIVVPFTCSGIATGLALGTPIWIDLSLAAPNGGVSTDYDLSVSAVEV